MQISLSVFYSIKMGKNKLFEAFTSSADWFVSINNLHRPKCHCIVSLRFIHVFCKFVCLFVHVMNEKNESNDPWIDFGWNKANRYIHLSNNNAIIIDKRRVCLFTYLFIYWVFLYRFFLSFSSRKCDVRSLMRISISKIRL